MKQNFYFLLLFTCSWAVKEELGGIDVDTLLNDPDALFNLEKRIGKMLADLDTEGQHNTNTDCNALKGVLNNGCEFHANKSSIIRTKESLAKNAKFLEDLSNVSCARDCTALCCDHEECDTAVYQDKDVHNCYLFKCGSPSMCVFAEHADYWMSSISKDVHNSHSHTPGMATVIHESELQDLGSDSLEQDVAPPVPPSTTVKTTTQKPGLGEHCASYSTKCNDSHAECLMGSCTCRVGYHEKHGICRKHCRDEEFECENVVPGVASRQCVHKSYMCDGSQDCADGSDEYRCSEKDKPDEDTAPTPRPVKIESPPEPVPTTQAPPVSEKVNPQEPKPTPSIPESPKQSLKTGSDSQEANDSDEQAPQSSNDSDESDSTDGKTQENQSTDTQSKGNSSGTQSGVGGSGQFRFLNVESVEVDSYTDNSQGPIVALSLGLAITVVLLIFVGCRLRTVKRRLRKGRALHSNEADYLINGMYL